MGLAILFASLGGLAVNLLYLAELRNVPKAERPDLKDWHYWTPFLIHPALGALIAWAYVNSGQPLSPMLAINVGITAPLLIRSTMDALPKSIGWTATNGTG